MDATSVSINWLNLKNLGQTNEITSVSTSNAGGKLIFNSVSFDNLFSDNKTLVSVDLTNLETKNINSMFQTFYNCSNLKSINWGAFDSSKVTSMYETFRGCSSLKSIDLSGFNTSNVTKFSRTFADCSSLTSLDLSNFNTAKATTMSDMFNGCSSLSSLNISSFDTSNVTTLSGMFFGCKSLKTIDLRHFDTSQCTRLGGMFWGCSSLESIDLSSFDTSNVDTMGYMFKDCTSLKSLDVSHFDTSKVTTMERMFENIPVEYLDVSHFNTSQVKNMYWMFSGCTNLTHIDVSNFDTSNVTNMSYMFNKDYKLQNLDVTGFDTSKVTDVSGMFWGYAKNVDQTQQLDLRNFFSKLPDGIYNIGMLESTNNLLVVAPEDKIVNVMSFFPSKPVYVDKNNKETQVDVTALLSAPVANPSDYIKSYVDAALEKNGLAYKKTPETFTLRTKVDVVPKRGQMTFRDRWVVLTDDNKVVVGKINVAGIVYSTIGVWDEAQGKYVVDADELNSKYSSRATISTAYATGDKVDYYKLADRVIYDGNDNYPTLYMNDEALIENFDKAKEFITSNYKDATKPDIKYVTISDDGTVTATNPSHGLTLNGKFAWKNMADDSNVSVKDKVDFADGKTPDASSMIISGLPTGATPSWDKTPTAEDPTGTIKVTFADGTSKEYPVTARVYSLGDVLTADDEASQYKDWDADELPYKVADEVKFQEGKLPSADTLVTGDLPDGAKASWGKEPTADDPAGTVRIMFDDGSYIDYPVSAKIYKLGDVLTGTDADMYKDLDSDDMPYQVAGEVKYPEGKLPGADTLVTGDHPAGAKATWAKEPSLDDPTGTVRVTFEDGSYIDYPVTAKIYSLGDPLTADGEADEYKDLDPDQLPYQVPGEVKFQEGQLPPASSVVTGTLPDGAVPSWQKEPTEDDTAGTIRITFEDGTYIDYPVTGNIYKLGDPLTYDGEASEYKDLDPEDLPYKVPSEITYEDGKLPAAGDVVTGDLPAGAVPSWSKEPTDDDPEGTIRITFEDGTYIDYPVSAKIYKLGDALTWDGEDEGEGGDADTEKGTGSGDVSGEGSGSQSGEESATGVSEHGDAVLGQDGISQTAVTTAAGKKTDQKKLPQTGDAQVPAWLAALLLPLGLLGAVKRRHN
ncbi:BspA family leucine-rich repeat surface protein [Limosilactobacillus sp.]|uniref:BspA family leucine-rich repeat surface protein n=1 Tax=Limosilactobacillus sp. TaxID=2773925 RepID=UPI0030C71D25